MLLSLDMYMLTYELTNRCNGDSAFCVLFFTCVWPTLWRQTVSRILHIRGAHSPRLSSFTPDKSIIFPNVWISGLTHFLQCFSWATLGLHSAHFWAKSFFPMFLLGWSWARFGLSRFFQCFCWAGVGPVVG